MEDSKFITNLREKYEFLAVANCEELRLLQNASGISIYIYEIRNSGTVLFFGRSYKVDLLNIFGTDEGGINRISINNLYIWDRILDKVISNTELMTARIATSIATEKYKEKREEL